jgi:predicted DCC family thiol-disulfide oxidoreductase YuxK
MTDALAALTEAHPAAIVYDGACPFCRRYIRLLRLKQAVGPVELIDARGAPAAVGVLRKAGCDLNEGMVFLHGGGVYFGEEAMHRLALLTTPSDAFNRITAWVFARPALGRAVYPAFKLARRAALALLRRPPV